MTKLSNLKLQTLEGKKWRNLKRKRRRDWKKRTRFRYQQETASKGGIFTWKEILREVEIRVGPCSQQTMEVCPWKGESHLAVCHTAAFCHPLWPATHLLYPMEEKDNVPLVVLMMYCCNARGSSWRLRACFACRLLVYDVYLHLFLSPDSPKQKGRHSCHVSTILCICAHCEFMCALMVYWTHSCSHPCSLPQ